MVAVRLMSMKTNMLTSKARRPLERFGRLMVPVMIEMRMRGEHQRASLCWSKSHGMRVGRGRRRTLADAIESDGGDKGVKARGRDEVMVAPRDRAKSESVCNLPNLRVSLSAAGCCVDPFSTEIALETLRTLRTLRLWCLLDIVSSEGLTIRRRGNWASASDSKRLSFGQDWLELEGNKPFLTKPRSGQGGDYVSFGQVGNEI